LRFISIDEQTMLNLVEKINKFSSQNDETNKIQESELKLLRDEVMNLEINLKDLVSIITKLRLDLTESKNENQDLINRFISTNNLSNELYISDNNDESILFKFNKIVFDASLEQFRIGVRTDSATSILSSTAKKNSNKKSNVKSFIALSEVDIIDSIEKINNLLQQSNLKQVSIW
jgi:hypothetical protein